MPRRSSTETADNATVPPYRRESPSAATGGAARNPSGPGSTPRSVTYPGSDQVPHSSGNLTDVVDIVLLVYLPHTTSGQPSCTTAPE
jgi:hypothetical protein